MWERSKEHSRRQDILDDAWSWPAEAMLTCEDVTDMKVSSS